MFPEAIFSKQSFINRAHPKIYECFKMIFGTQKLHVNIDSYGFARGTRNLIMNDKIVNRKDWKCALNPHWDINPFYTVICWKTMAIK
eukprot:UN14253